ncbi:putative membrane protein YdfK [Vibrio aerogenes CECT 7868]|uniref:Putative membrane protein YdfK n=1 Tax=Vibrio aerogenes CECT 7868 TaxID=1216006 RepID=A0A1M6DZS5_9VIBR|nr:DUF554 domain-containing protein [Vibrio aerogenes]SHI78762.1 putative membrane protein YdfK [Vibrio aerogenes CECT 7868]
MIGPVINSAAIIIGSGVGALFGDKIPSDIQKRMPIVFGFASMGLGIAMVMKLNSLPVVILTLLIGTIIGELIQLEEKITVLAGKLKQLVEKFTPPQNPTIQQNEYMDTFISILILFSMSGTGIFGSMNEGVTGDASLLIVKSFLDFFTAIIFAIRLGLPVATLAIPQCLIQLILFFSASALLPLTDAKMVADFSAVGGLVMFATGFRICNIVSYPVANMIPALILAMPVSALWAGIMIQFH